MAKIERLAAITKRLALSRRFARLAALACLLAAIQPALAADAAPWPLALRAQMLQLAEVDWRLRLAATPRCPRLASGLGMTVDHAAAYPEPARAALRRQLRLGNLPQVAAVASGSPAEQAGLRPGDEILAIGGVAMVAELAQSADPSLFAEEVTDRLARLPAGQPATVTVRRGRARLGKTVIPLPVCASRTMLETGGALDAFSDGSDLAVTSALVDFTANDDELALIMGHELAHVIMHREARDAAVDPLVKEQEADLLGAQIAHCAGYDVQRGAAFWPRFEAHDLARSERLATHPSPGQREQRIRTAAGGFACPIAAGS